MRKYLSAKEVARITKPGRYAIGHGAYLQISPNGGRSWLLRYRHGTKSTCMGLGSCDYVSLLEARDKAINAQRQRLAGLDPLNEKRRAKISPSVSNAPTFERAALQFISEREASWRNGASAYQWRLSLAKYVFPHFGSISVANLTTQHVLAVLKPVWTTVPETARRVRNRVELILSFATAHQWRTGENPASWQILKNLLPDLTGSNGEKHLAAMPYKELPTLMSQLRQDDSVAARAIEFAVLTAARPSEAGGARWSEVVDGMWILPPERMKRNREHRVPLSTGALAVLERLHRLDDYLFPGAKAAYTLPSAMLTTLRRFGRTETVHGFRSAFSTWASEQTSFPDVVIELALAHQVGTAVQRAYARSDLLDQRRRLMQDWSDFCAQAHVETEVVRLRQSAAGGSLQLLRSEKNAKW
jgi:integrase